MNLEAYSGDLTPLTLKLTVGPYAINREAHSGDPYGIITLIAEFLIPCMSSWPISQSRQRLSDHRLAASSRLASGQVSRDGGERSPCTNYSALAGTGMFPALGVLAASDWTLSRRYDLLEHGNHICASCILMNCYQIYAMSDQHCVQIACDIKHGDVVGGVVVGKFGNHFLQWTLRNL